MNIAILQHFMASGGVTIYILFFCWILSIAVMAERIFYFHMNTRQKRIPLMPEIKSLLLEGGFEKAKLRCANGRSTVSRVVYEGLALEGSQLPLVKNAMERQISVEIKSMEKYTNILGTIGSTAVYIGLFGTVIGIIRAFGDIGATGAGDINIVIGGIAEALISTAAGICVAVPAVIAFNIIMKRIDNAILDMELCASELIDTLDGMKK